MNEILEFINKKVPRKENESTFDHILRKNEYLHTKNHPYKVSGEEALDYLINKRSCDSYERD